MANANSEQIPDNVSEELDYEDELALEDEDISFDLEPKEASGSGATENTEIVTAEKEKEIESTGEAGNDSEAEAQNEPEPQTEEADTENAAIDEEVNEECEDDAPEDLLDLGADLDFSELDDVSKRYFQKQSIFKNEKQFIIFIDFKSTGAEEEESDEHSKMEKGRHGKEQRI